MTTEDYVSYETAKLLKEKGFDGDIDLWFDENGATFFEMDYNIMNNWRIRTGHKVYPHPTLQMAIKWLREVHDIYIMIDKDFATENGWHYVIVTKQDWNDNIDNGLIQQESNNYTYEFACEEAIKYCLENLV